jgi:hypothetical protein
VVPNEKKNEFRSYSGIKDRLGTEAYCEWDKICDGVDNHFSLFGLSSV